MANQGQPHRDVYFVFMHADPVYERLKAKRSKSKEGSAALDAYLSSKHERLLEKLLPPNTYRRRSSLAIVDAFAVEITDEQAVVLRAAEEVRVVEKNQELAMG